MLVERALLNGILSNSPLCAVRLDGSVCVNGSRLQRRCLFDRSPLEAKNEFHQELSRSLRNVRSTDVAIVAGDSNA